MGESKHTPGPWRFEWDGSEAVIIGRPTWPCVRHRVEGEWQLAVTDDLIDEHPEESEANARLIAAAPELLAALDELVDALTAGYVPQQDGSMLKEARALHRQSRRHPNTQLYHASERCERQGGMTHAYRIHRWRS